MVSPQPPYLLYFFYLHCFLFPRLLHSALYSCLTMIGRTLGHYRIEASLGEGGMGVVYRARDTRLERDVALKLLSEKERAGGASRRLLDEARAASALNHPHVATVYEVGEAGGHSYIAMEYVAGRPLNQQIPADGLPVEQVLRYGQQIASALTHAHERGIIHRDLKSANVVITPEGHAKVLDFGLAQRLGMELAEATQSREASAAPVVAGTLAYMAPEVLRGEPADARSDIWSLGVVLYEMAAGRLPFAGRTGYDLSSAILRERSAVLPPQVSAGSRGVIERCLAKEPGQRYRSAGEVQAALEAIGSSRELEAVAPGETRNARPAWWRRKLVWALAALAVVMALALWKGPIHISFDQAPFSVSIGRTEMPAPGPRTSTGGRASANSEANEYFERGLMLLVNQFELERSRQMFERSLQIDEKFAEARAWYGFTHMLLVDGGFSNDSSWLYRAEQELQRALADDPDSARVHSALAGVYIHQGRMDQARGEARKALELNPREFDAEVQLFIIDHMMGNMRAAKQGALSLAERMPLFWVPHNVLGEILQNEGDSPGARREFEKVLEQDPHNFYARRNLARAHMDGGELALAREELQRIAAAHRQNYWVRLAWALQLALEAKQEEARREFDDDARRFADANMFSTLEAAEIYAALGETERALEWLDRAVRKGDERLEWFRINPHLAPLRDNPRFREIIDSIAFRRQQRSKTGS